MLEINRQTVKIIKSPFIFNDMFECIRYTWLPEPDLVSVSISDHFT